ncbi:MAG TPA: LuxR C-terminal-related transcriptional regulator [Niastella sp.]
MKNQADEKYIIELIREGKANKEIADALHKSIGATENIIHRLLRKYNCKNRVQLALIDTQVPRESMET